MESENSEEFFDLLNQIDIDNNPGSENVYEFSELLSQINIENNPGSEKNDRDTKKPETHKPQSKTLPKPIDFENYIKENFDNKIKILERTTFKQIERPIIIFFNHFREKCAYYTEVLKVIYTVALKYAERIEFIVADIMDIDIMDSNWNPLDFFCNIVDPKYEGPTTYIIDEKKRILQHLDLYQTNECLMELCEKFVTEKLYISQDIPENNETNLVKICVYNNYEELVLKSSKNIFLIVGLESYQSVHDYEPNYDNIALAVKDYNIDIVYMEGDKNYVPFEYQANSYPTILFIPSEDKNNFIYYQGIRTEKHIIKFLRKLIKQPKFLCSKQMQQQSREKRKPLNIPVNFGLSFDELEEYLNEYYVDTIKMLDRRRKFNNIKKPIMLIFMNFQGKLLTHHIIWLDKIYQVAKKYYFRFDYLVADIKDINKINKKWNYKDFIDLNHPEEEVPKIFAIDQYGNKFEFKNFTSEASLFYFTHSFVSGDLFITQDWPRDNHKQLVKTCVAHNFKVFINKSKKHIFLTFYWPDQKDSELCLNLLPAIAENVLDLNVEVVKFNARDNYVDLEFVSETYPVQYFIPCNNREENVLYSNDNLSKEEILRFIKTNVEKYKQ